MFRCTGLRFAEGDGIRRSRQLKKFFDTTDTPSRTRYSFVLPHQSAIEKFLGISNVSEGLLYEFHMQWVNQRSCYWRSCRTRTAATFGECLNYRRSAIHKKQLGCIKWTNANT